MCAHEAAREEKTAVVAPALLEDRVEEYRVLGLARG
jgi:hypothetical protein